MPSSRSTSPDDVGVFKVHSTLGGFPAFRFESYRTDPKNFPKVNYAANLPSSIQDHINNQPEEVRMLSEIREVFEAMILENTADDEREAPPIVIQNDVDEEPTPPWEFWYSNKMWHGKGVPDPDLKNLKGCDCRGACNPKNKACACAQRQCQVIGDIKASEFAYDKNGRLKFPGFPVFECNNTCWCGPECSNRVCRL
jgi:histone-lysine N-methyltransferase SUV39H